MMAKEYLQRAYRIDQRINAKMEQLSSLKALSTKATSTLTDMPKGTRNVHVREDIILKMMDLENEINADINELLDLKQNILSVIKLVDNSEYQTLLELRYLCFKPWEKIALDMGYSLHHLYKIHKSALNSCSEIIKMIPKVIE